MGEEPSICHYKILSMYWLISLRSWLTQEELFCKDPTALCMILSISLYLITNRFDQVISDIRRCLSACEKTTPIILQQYTGYSITATVIMCQNNQNMGVLQVFFIFQSYLNEPYIIMQSDQINRNEVEFCDDLTKLMSYHVPV